MNLYKKFLSIPKWLRYIFLFSISNILLVELYLKDINNSHIYLVRLGDMLLRLCYSFLAAFIFYFIAVHLEKEKKRLSLYRVIQQKTLRINNEIRDIFDSLFRATNQSRFYSENVTFSEIQSALNAINTDLPFRSFGDNFVYQNMYEFLYYKKLNIKALINEILRFPEYLDNEYMQYLTFIEDQLMNVNVFSGRQMLGVRNLQFADNTFQQLHDHSIDILNRSKITMERFESEYFQQGKEYRKKKGWD